MAPFGWYRFYPLPESIGIQGVQSILKIQQCLGRHLTVNPPIKIAGSAKVSLQVRHGTTEEVSVIDRIGIQPTISVFIEDDLPVSGADVGAWCKRSAGGTAHGVNANQLFRWRHELKRGELVEPIAGWAEIL